MLAGVCGTDPFRLMPVFLDSSSAIGFSGVQNFPTVGLFDGTLPRGLEETGMGYGKEVEMIRSAHELDLLTSPVRLQRDEARAMAEAGADVLVPHMGLTTERQRSAPSTALTLDDCVARVQGMHDAASGSIPTSSCCATAARSPSPTMPRMSSRITEGVVGFFGASLDGAPARRDSDDREHAPFQVDPRQGGEQ